METYTFKTALDLARGMARHPLRLFASVSLTAFLAATGCGEIEGAPVEPTDMFEGPATPGTGPDAGSSSNQPPASPGDAGGTPTTPPQAGSLDTAWCKVKQVLDAKCVACHQTPAVAGAPFPLITYEHLTAPHPTMPGTKVYERVGVRVHADQSSAEGLGVMPPGAQLPAEQRAIIDAWVAADAPAGENPTCTPPPGSIVPDAGAEDEVWPLPECDEVYTVTSRGPGGGPYSVAPNQEIHPQVVVPAPWGNEKVQAIAFKTITDNKAILHHWILNGGGAFLTGWAPGEDGIKKMGPDIGMNMPTGNLTLDMHYNSYQATKTETDASGVEICVVKEGHFRKNHAAVTMRLAAIPNIPNNSVMLENKASCTVSGNTPVTLLSASPHAHTLAVRMLFTVTKKNGQVITMHDLPFQFGEQKSYKLDPPVVVEQGDVIDTSCFFTNMTGRTVRFGEDTGNEMCFNFALYYPAGALSCSGGIFGL